MKQKLRLVLAEDQVMLLDAFAALLSMEPDFEIMGKALRHVGRGGRAIDPELAQQV